MYVNVGIDIGSTTVKIVVVRDGEIIHKHYERHFSKVREKAVELVRAARELIGEDTPLHCSITGSAGLRRLTLSSSWAARTRRLSF